MRVFVTLLCLCAPLALAVGCGGTAPLHALSARVIRGAGFAADSIVVDGSFTIGADDGRGPIDSVRIDVVTSGIQQRLTYRPPNTAFGATIQYQSRSEAPAPSGGSGSATYTVYASAWTFRRGLATETRSNSVAVVVVDVPPPGGIHSIQARKL